MREKEDEYGMNLYLLEKTQDIRFGHQVRVKAANVGERFEEPFEIESFEARVDPTTRYRSFNAQCQNGQRAKTRDLNEAFIETLIESTLNVGKLQLQQCQAFALLKKLQQQVGMPLVRTSSCEPDSLDARVHSHERVEQWVAPVNRVQNIEEIHAIDC